MTIAIIAEITGNMTKNSNFHDNVEEMSFSLVFFFQITSLIIITFITNSI